MESQEPIQNDRESTLPKRILVVDDDRMIRDFCMRLLASKGYDVAGAQNGVAALDRLAAAPFDLVLTDIQMPIMDGITLLKQLRARGNDVDVIVCTAYATVDTALNALKQGAFDYLIKPISVSDLERAVERAIEWRAIQREKKRLTEIVALYEISQAFTATLDTNHAVGEIVGLLRRYFAPQTLSLSLFDPDKQRLFLLANERANPQLPLGSSTPLSPAPDARILLSAHDRLSGAVGEPGEGHLVLLELR